MEFHEVANIFPMMSGEEFDNLCRDIAANGQHEPIWTYDEKIIDGRNRYNACLEIGINPEFRQWDGNGSLVSFVLSLNLHRRHLTSGQRAAVATDVLPMLEKENPQGNRKDLTGGNITTSDKAKNRDKAGEMLGVSGAYIQTAKKIKNEAPDLFEKVQSGEWSLPKAKTAMKKREVVAHLEDVSVQEVKAAQGVYDVLVIDPPWPMQKIEREVAPNQVAFEYPVMTLDEISELDLPAADNCHVWLWTTQKFLPSAFEILKQWGVNYICTFGWKKNGGFQPFGLPQYNEEFALYGRIGTPQFIDQKSFFTCFEAKRGAHSEKPQEFYDTICRVTAGRRLDMFNRRTINGFDGWGKETPDV
ncbi:MAG: hypothetical protein GY755_19965 [Chloroflexi bacterium]|nr:hypothetical protein [Chloroflexota bacterium]